MIEKEKRVESRSAWVYRKFGKCRGMEQGCEQGITREDSRPLHITWFIPGLGRTTSLDIFGGTSTKPTKTRKPIEKRKSRIQCRHCGGCHLTAKCLNRSGDGNRFNGASHPKSVVAAPPLSYYLGPPPGTESNPMDFEQCDSE